MTMKDAAYDEFRESRKEEGRKIDPETATVCWEYGETLNP